MVGKVVGVWVYVADVTERIYENLWVSVYVYVCGWCVE